jgi:catechol 2,3-dioxygenase-like lactoylglutathione lyase family enzyme
MPINHVTLPTRSFDATVDFMSRVLELPATEHPKNVPSRCAWFEVAQGQSIHVVELNELGPVSNEREHGRHVALSFPHARWLRIKNQLERANVEIIAPERESKMSRFFVYDPNGYCFELVLE